MKCIPKTEEFEKCVICGNETGIPISMPVELRADYEVGVGQICSNCAKRLQNETNTTQKKTKQTF